MNELIELKAVIRFRQISKISSIILCFGGLVVLIGWAFDISYLKSISPDWVSMKANTAVCFLLLGISLWFYQENKKGEIPSLSFRRIAGFCAGIVAIVGLLSFIEYAFKMDFGIDQILFKEPIGAIATSHPGRMAPNTAINFFIVGVSLLLLDMRNKILIFISQGFMLIEGAISLLAFVGYLYGVKALYGLVSQWTVMAAHTAVLFVVCFPGVFFIRPVSGLMSLFSRKSLGGSVLRLALFPTIFFLVLTGFLGELGIKAGFYDVITGNALITVIRVAFFSIIVWIISGLLDKVDSERVVLNNELLKSKDAEWRRTFNAIKDFIFILDKDHVLCQVNDSFLEAMKCKEEDIIGKKCYEVVHRKSSPWPNCPFSETKKDHLTHSEIVMDSNIGVPLLVSISPLFNSRRELSGAVHIARDISALKKAETQYKVIYESSMDAIMTLSMGGAFKSGNPATVKLFACKDEQEFISQTAASLSPEYQPDGQLSSVKAQEMMKIAMEKGSNFFEWIHKRIDGKEFPATVLLTKINLENEDILQSTVRDITKEKQIMTELQKKIDTLERFQNVATDRELKMKELKGRIKELELKLEEKG